MNFLSGLQFNATKQWSQTLDGFVIPSLGIGILWEEQPWQSVALHLRHWCYLNLLSMRARINQIIPKLILNY